MFATTFSVGNCSLTRTTHASIVRGSARARPMPLVPPATRIVLSLSLTRAPPAASLGSSYSPLLLDVVGRQKACRLVRRQTADQYRASRRRDDAIAPERFP